MPVVQQMSLIECNKQIISLRGGLETTETPPPPAMSLIEYNKQIISLREGLETTETPSAYTTEPALRAEVKPARYAM